MDWIKDRLGREPKQIDLTHILEYISQIMFMRKYPPSMRPTRDSKRRKLPAIDWLKTYDDYVYLILQHVDLVDLTSNPKNYIRDDLKPRCQYDRRS
jgi:hypothetical protein